MVKRGEAQAFVSAGNTGALLTGATVIVGRIKGVERPALGTLLPTETGRTLLIDSGANVDAKPEYFKEHVRQAIECVKDKPEDKQLIFLKSWNEWGEGNYMEPDLQYGLGYLEALTNAIDDSKDE